MSIGRLIPPALAVLLLHWSFPARAQETCADGPRAAASQNAASLTQRVWSPFGRPEAGWEIYEPLVTHEIATGCPAWSPGFAASLGRWQAARRLAATGAMDQPTFTALKQAWESRRPFVAESRRACPNPPDPSILANATPEEGYSRKPIQLLPQALAAYRRLVAAARVEVPAVAADHRLLSIFSGYRSPAYDAARCATEGNCQNITRATCSAHRTGLAMDLYLGAAPGFAPDSSDDVARLFLTRTAAYRWLVGNAARFGFANYPFEPWHWEWTGGGG